MIPSMRHLFLIKVWIWAVVFYGITSPLVANPFLNILNQSIPDLVLKTIHENINGTLQAQKVTFSPPSTLIFDNLNLKDHHQETVIGVKKVTIDISLLSLFIGRIKANSIVAETPDIHLRTIDGKLNLAAIFSKVKAKKTNVSLPLIDLSHIEITNGRVTWIDEENPKLVFDKIFSSGKIKLLPLGTEIYITSLKSPQGNFSFEQKKWDIQTLFLENASYKNQILKIKNATAKILDTAIQAQGSIQFKGQQFLIKSQLGPLEIFNLPIQKTILDLEINSKQILINKSILELNDNAAISAKGLFDLQTHALKIVSNVNKLPFRSLRKSFNIDIETDAFLSGQIDVSGIISKNHPIQIKANTDVEDLCTYDFQLASSRLDLNLLFTPQKNIEFLKATLNADALNINLTGNIDLATKNSNLAFNIDIQDPFSFYSKTQKGIFAKGFHAKGQLSGPLQEATIRAQLQLDTFQKDATTGKKLSAVLYASPHIISFKHIAGTLAKGRIHGNLSIDKKNQRALSGRLQIDEASFSQVPLPASIRSQISGSINAQIDLLGTLEQPRLQAKTKFSNVHLQTLFFQKINAKLNYADQQIQLSELEAHMPYGEMSVPLMTIDLSKKSLQGLLVVHHISLEGFPLLSKYDLTGTASGSLQIGNNFEHPKIQGTLRLKDITWKKQPIGNGKNFVWYQPSQSFLQLSGELAQEDAIILYRSTIDFAQQKIRADILLKDFSILPWTSLPSSFTMPLKGRISGDLQVDGSLSLPNIKTKITAPDIQTLENITSDDKAPRLEKQWISAGPLALSAQLKNGKLSASLCGFSQNFSLPTCTKNDRLHLLIDGFFTSTQNYDLQIDGAFNLTKLEQWIRFIKKEFNSVDTNLQIHSRLTQKNKLTFSGQADVSSLSIAMPGIVPIALKKETKIQFHNQGIQFLSPALFSLATGQLSVSGFAFESQLKLDLNGRIPLVFTKYFASFLTSADGLATGELKLRGSVKHPLIDGFIVPDKGAFIKPAALFDDINFNSGQVNFKSNHFKKELSIWFDKLDMTVGDGDAHLNGNAVLHTQYQPNSSQFAFWDLQLSGNEIVLRNQRDWMETNFNISLQTIDKKDSLTGRLNISDGYFFKKFSFRNFILSSDKTNRLVLPQWLWPIQVDLKIAVSSFHAQTQMSAFFIDSQLTANLELIGSLASPRLIGSVDIAEGIFKFPLLYFEIPPASIPFKNTPGRFIDPQIRILAYTDLPQKRFNLSADTTLELSLAGNLEQMKLDIKTLSGDKTFDRSKLLLLLLGASNGGTEMLEDMLSSYTGTRILIGSSLQTEGIATQVQWQLNPRLEFEGTAKTTAANVDFQDLKLKLMLFDHLPFGKQLFLESVLFSPATEGSDTSIRKDLRLKFRVMEQ